MIRIFCSKNTGPHWSKQTFMPRRTKKIYVISLHINIFCTGNLRTVKQKQNAVLMRNFSEHRIRKLCSEHIGSSRCNYHFCIASDKSSVGFRCLFQFSFKSFSNGKADVSAVFQFINRSEHRIVLKVRNYNMSSFFTDAHEHRIKSFRTVFRKNEIFRRRKPKKIRCFFPRFKNFFCRFHCKSMTASSWICSVV